MGTNYKITKELSVKEKHCENLDIKKKLAKVAVELINDNESIIIDSGTTTEEVAKLLIDHNNLIVMTNGLNIVAELAQANNIEVMNTGGTLRKKSLSFYGNKAEASLNNLRFDKLILGVDGIDIQVGLTTHFEPEANLNRLMCNISKKIIAVTDSSKFDRSSFHVISYFDSIDILITDSNIPEQYKEYLLSKNIELIIVDV